MATDEPYSNYREGRVRRAITKLRDSLGNKDPSEFPDTISENEIRDANTQASRLSEHIPLAKIHKFTWLQEQHGDGIPLDTHFQNATENNENEAHNAPLGTQLKFRFVNPLKNSPSAGLGKLIDSILKPIQNSGLRTESIPEYAKKIQSDILENPPTPAQCGPSALLATFHDPSILQWK